MRPRLGASGVLKTTTGPVRVVVEPKSLLPRLWATAWQRMREGTSPAPNTEMMHAGHVAAFYMHCDQPWGPGALDAALSQGDEKTLCEMLETFYLSLTGTKPYTTATVQRWDSTRIFVLDVVRLLQPTLGATGRVQMLLEALGRLQVPRGTEIDGARALPAATLNDLLEIARPDSQRNPFKGEQVQWRNWLIVNLLLGTGIRRGEALLLLVDSLRIEVHPTTGETVRYLNVTTTAEEDERASRPYIKTDASRRQIPVGEALTQLWVSYLSVRPKGTTNFLLTASGDAGLSKESVDAMFRAFTAAMREDALAQFRERTGGKKHVSSHDLRHTRATVLYPLLLQQGDSRELALQRMRAYFGWERESDMPDYYARAAIQDDLVRAWESVFDDNLAVLRRLG